MKTSFNYCMLVVAALAFNNSLMAADFITHHEHVLGTSLELRVETDSSEQAQQAEATALEEIDRLANVLSRYDSGSELMRWQRGEITGSVSEDLATVLERAEFWRLRTHGAFDVRVGALSQLWQQASETQQLPSAESLSTVVTKLKTAPWMENSQRIFVRQDHLPVSLDALAKGYILDKVCETIRRRCPAVKQFTVNIGGDLRTTGQRVLKVSITDPESPAEAESPLTTVDLVGPVGFATSGGYRRYESINGRQYSHILDPRSGQPVTDVVSATVIAPTAMDADAAATAISVLGKQEGLQLIESLPGFECLIVTSRRSVLVSSGWATNQSIHELSFVSFNDDPQPNSSTTEESAKPKTGLFVNFTLTRPAGGRYRRPYVAIWLEDTDGYPVKTALLWMMTEQPGPRWHRDLTRWYRNDRLRKIVEDKELIGTISGATRGPGQYDAHFDGTDNLGKPLPPGKYTLCIETAREHGTYQIIRKSIELGSKPVNEQKLKGNVEVDEVSFKYIPVDTK